MKQFLNKLKSRKFLTCVAGVVMGACMIFGLDEAAISTVSGAITTVASIVIYIYSEGKIDAASIDKVKNGIDDIQDAFDTIKNIED